MFIYPLGGKVVTDIGINKQDLTQSGTNLLPFVRRTSERELEVLRLQKTDLSGPEIADELMIALSTMRTNAQNISSKLSVRSRREAFRKAEELNLR